MTTIRRRFADVAHGQVHYRSAGSGPPLMLVHACPGSARQMAPLIGALADRFRVIAPDLAGLGDSDPLAVDQPEAGDFAAALLAFADAIGLDRFAAYGTHTGAAVVTEVALAAPDRIGRVVLDGMAVFTADERADMLARYARPFAPESDGSHLIRAFMFCRDQLFFFPWYARDRAHRRDGGMMPAGALNDWAVEVIKAATTYHLAYNAAFRHDGAGRGALLTQPVLALAAADDPLHDGTAAAARELRDGRFVALPRFDSPAYLATLADAIAGFVTADPPR